MSSMTLESEKKTMTYFMTTPILMMILIMNKKNISL